MAKLNGTLGVIQIGSSPASIGNATKWEFTITNETEDSTVLGDTWRDNESIIRTWGGTIEGFFDDTDTQMVELETALLAGSSVDLVGLTDTDTTGTATYTGTALVTDSAIPVEVGGLIKVSFTVIGKGALAVGAVT